MQERFNIDHTVCTGCGLCVATCPFGALSLAEELRCESAKCCFCGLCAESCPLGAITIECEQRVADINPDDYQGVWIFVEQLDGVLDVSAAGILREGRMLADASGSVLAAVIMGSCSDKVIDDLRASGVDQVYVVEHSLLTIFEPSLYAAALAQLIERHKPAILLAAATVNGRAFFAKSAVKAGTGLTADCTALAIERDSGLLLQTRPAFGGNIMAQIITPQHRPQMATVRPRPVHEAAQQSALREMFVIRETVELPENAPTRLIRREHAINCEDFAGARIVIAGGMGLQKRDNFQLLFDLAERVGGVVGASRACVDAGWVPATRQIGQTGRSVAPDIYLACGISGAVQHIEGIRSSGKIIAVNRDPEAPIMDVADIAIVGDLFDIIPRILKKDHLVDMTNRAKSG